MSRDRETEPAPAIPVILTQVAYAGWDDHHHRGHRVHGELAGEETYAGLMALAVGAPRMSPDARAVLDDVATVISIAEPRIWPLKISRLVSSYGRVVPGTTAGALSFESELIGPWTTGRTAAIVADAMSRLGEVPTRAALEEEAARLIATHGRLVGFGVPFRPQDERVIALRSCLERRGRLDEPHWAFSERLWAVMRERHRLEPNIGSGVAAAMLDLGLSPPQISALTVALNQNIFVANAVEGAEQAPEVLRQLPDHVLHYAGAPARTSPRAARSSATEVSPRERPTPRPPRLDRA